MEPAGPPFEAYSGHEPYVFVSYAHRDAQAVFPEIQRLHQQGFRIWYDEGIDPGNEWPEEIARAVLGCELFVVFVTDNAVASVNVRNEIAYALGRKKPFLAVHLAETKLPPGLELQLGNLQAVLKWKMTTESYERKMGKTLSPSLRQSPDSSEEPRSLGAPGARRATPPAEQGPPPTRRTHLPPPPAAATQTTATAAQAASFRLPTVNVATPARFRGPRPSLTSARLTVVKALPLDHAATSAEKGLGSADRPSQPYLRGARLSVLHTFPAENARQLAGRAATQAMPRILAATLITKGSSTHV